MKGKEKKAHFHLVKCAYINIHIFMGRPNEFELKVHKPTIAHYRIFRKSLMKKRNLKGALWKHGTLKFSSRTDINFIYFQNNYIIVQRLIHNITREICLLVAVRWKRN